MEKAIPRQVIVSNRHLKGALSQSLKELDWTLECFNVKSMDINCWKKS